MANGTSKSTIVVKWTTAIVAVSGIAFTTFTFYDGRRNAALAEARSDVTNRISEVAAVLHTDIGEVEREHEREVDQLIRRIERLESLLLER